MAEIVVVLHNVRSLHNVGSIFRTADAVGVKKIYLCGITPSPLDRFGKLREQFKKVSLGAEKFVEWESSRSTSSVIKELKKEKYKILAIEQARRATPYYKLGRSYVNNFKLCLVLGNEIKGIPSSILKKSDKILEIPMRGAKESLNVAVAFGIVAYGLTVPVL